MTQQIRYEKWFLPFSVPLGLGPKRSAIRIGDDAVTVTMGWGFDATIPLSAITAARPYDRGVLGWGVHGDMRGRWLVNGSSKGIVEITIEPSVTARVVGRKVRLRTLLVSVTEPDELIAALAEYAMR